MSYAITFRGIDGTSTDRFKTLKDAAKYLRDRYLGSDFVRGDDCLGSEYGYYTLEGFTLKDVGRFSYDEGFRDFEWFVEYGGCADRANTKNS